MRVLGESERRFQRVHETVQEIYCWEDVTERAVAVYKAALEEPPVPFIERLSRYHNFHSICSMWMRRYYGCGLWAGKFFCVVAALDYLLVHATMLILRWIHKK